MCAAKNGSGRKFKLDFNDVKARVKAVPFSLRNLFRSLSPQVGIPRASLHRYLKLGIFWEEGERCQTNIETREQGCQRGVLS